MLTKKFIKLNLILIWTVISNHSAFATNQEPGPWSCMLYRGATAQQTFAQTITGDYSSFGETIYTAEFAYTLDKTNVIRRFFSYLFDTVQVAGNLAYRHDYKHNDNVKEGNIYLIWRWTKFPWERYLKNSFAIGDGISYDSHPPFANVESGKARDNYSKLLNYLMLEITGAIPSQPQWQLVFRLHHTCTAWGTFPKNANAGSTNVGVGIRFSW